MYHVKVQEKQDQVSIIVNGRRHFCGPSTQEKYASTKVQSTLLKLVIPKHAC